MPSQDTNDPGGPWGSQSHTPPDLELLIKRGLDSLKRLLPGGSPGGTLALLTLFIIGLSIWSSYYTVPSDSVAVMQRFGMHLKEVPPGLHFKLPLGIDKATTVPVIGEGIKPYSWYVKHVLVGANETSLPDDYIQRKIIAVE